MADESELVVLPHVPSDKLAVVEADLKRANYEILSEERQTDDTWTIKYVRAPRPAGQSEVASVDTEFDSAPEVASAQAADASAAGGESGDDDAVIPPFSVTNVRPMFTGAKVENIRANLPLILRALQAFGLTEPIMVLYSLATLRAENSGFLPTSEVQGPSNTPPGGPPFGRYDGETGQLAAR
jgi:hypothetical protein